MTRRETEEQLVLRGQKVKVVCAERAVSSRAGVVIDYFRATFKRSTLLRQQCGVYVHDMHTDEQIVGHLASHLSDLLGFQLGVPRPGRDYYDHSFTIVNEAGHEVASVSGGGESQAQTFCITITGTACTFAQKSWEKRLYKFLSQLDAKVTRVDLCRDFFSGKFGYSDAHAGYVGGEFDYRNRRPTSTQIGDFIGCNSRTFQVGKRESGKVFRGYEKGHQFKLMDDPWWRAEVELRGVDRIIDLEVLLRPETFFAGAYPFCARLLEDVEPEPIPTGRKIAEASVARLLTWFKRVVAPTIVHLSLDEGFDWVAAVAVEEAHRPTPRAIRGLSRSHRSAAIHKFLEPLTPPAPAGLVVV